MEKKTFITPRTEVVDLRLEERFTASVDVSTGTTSPVETMDIEEEVGW